MVDLRYVAGVIGRLLVQGIQVSLATVVLLSLWGLGQLPSGPNAPEQVGTFVWGFLFSWAFAAVLLVIFVGGQLLVSGYRRWTDGGFVSLRRPLGRLVFDVFLGLLAGIGIPLLLPEYRITILVASAVLAWAVLIHYAGDAILFGREQLKNA